MSDPALRPRFGYATIQKFRLDDGTFYCQLRRDSGIQVAVTVDPDVAVELVRRYGRQVEPDYISVESLVGLQVAYCETATGMLSSVTVLDN